MEVHYNNEKESKFYQDDKLLTRKHGQNCRKIGLRLSELYAADSLKDIPPHANCHPLDNNRKRQYGLDLSHPFRLIICPVGEYVANDIATIKSIKIIGIIDYH